MAVFTLLIRYTIVGGILLMMTSASNGFALSFMMATGKFVSWDLAEDAFNDMKSAVMLGGDHFLWVAWFVIGHFFAVAIITQYYEKLPIAHKRSQYSIIGDSYGANLIEKQQNKRRNIYAIVVYFIFVFVPFLLHPITSWSAIYRSEALTSDYYNFAAIIKLPFHSNGNALTREQLEQQRIENNSTTFNLTRSKDSIFTNVVYVFLESARSDMLPFDKESHFANTSFKMGNPIPEITPFLNQFFKDNSNTVHIENPRIASGYTIKSLMSTLCSVFPIPADFTKEHRYSIYAPCLPHLLNSSGFTTTHIQASDDSFDHQHDTIVQEGYETIMTKTSMDKFYKDNDIEIPEKVNPFGYSDKENIRFFENQLNISQTKGKPFFISHITNTMHHPYRTPKSFEKIKYVDDSENNDYLNAVRYTDGYLKDLMAFFKPVAKDTLFVFIGDHGIMAGEHHQYTSGQVKYENAYNVPFYLHSDNEIWNTQLAPKIRENLKDPGMEMSNIDIMPTIVDLLRLKKSSKFEKELGTPFKGPFEGFSMLRSPICNKKGPELKCREYSISFSNPGRYAYLIRKDHYKLISLKNGSKFMVNLNDDPEENNLIPISSIDKNSEMYKYFVDLQQKSLEMENDIKKKWNY